MSKKYWYNQYSPETGGIKTVWSDVPLTEAKTNNATIRQLSKYQIAMLRQMFLEEVIVETIARVDETGDLIVQYRGGIHDYDAIMRCKSIPLTEKTNQP